MDDIEKIKKEYTQLLLELIEPRTAFDNVIGRVDKKPMKMILSVDENGLGVTRYEEITDDDIDDFSHLKYKDDLPTKNIIIIGASPDAKVLQQQFLHENINKNMIVIKVDRNAQLKSIPDLMLEKLAKEKADLQSLITSAQYAREVELAESIFEYKKPKIGDIVYLPDLRKTRKEKKQQYNNNHRKNWMKRK